MPQHTFFIAPTEVDTGLTSITLGLIRAFDQLGLKVGTCKPIAHSEKDKQHRALDLITLASGIKPPEAISLSKAQKMISAGRQDRLMEEVIGMQRKVRQEVDVVIIEGVEPDRNEPFTAKLNVEMAKTLDAEVILVSSPKDKDFAQLSDHLNIAKNLFGGEKNPNLLGCIINKIHTENFNHSAIHPQLNLKIDISEGVHNSALNNLETGSFKVLGLIPWDPSLVAPRMKDIAQYLNADMINDQGIESARVQRISLCARTMPNMVNDLLPGTLVVTPGDRNDIILATAMAFNNGVPLSGMLLTSGIAPNENVMSLVNPSLSKLPILSVKSDTFHTASLLTKMSDGVTAQDTERVESIMNHMAAHINAEHLKDRLQMDLKVRLSPAAFRYQLVQTAQAANKCIVLPEGEEPRTIQAAAICQERNIANCILLGNRETIEQQAKSLGIRLPEGLTIVNPDDVRSQYIEPMVELRKHKQLSAPMAEAQLEDNVVLGTMMLALNEVDGLVSGAIHTTANTIRPALQLIKTAPNAKLVSSVFFMLLPEQVMVYGDCAVNPDPTAEELADIALQSAHSAKAFGIEPKVAMISYSTGSSGTGSDVEKVRSATQLAQEKQPNLILDGPLQYDAATTANVAASKAPNSKVAGQANVLIFPDLNTGNTTYKAVQRSANVISIGPMLQGLAKPVNDLSRGASVEDIIYTIALTAIQATQI